MNFKRFLFLTVATFISAFLSCEKDKETCDIDPGLIDCVGFPSVGFVVTRNGENIFNENTTTIEDIDVQGDDASNSELTLRTGFNTTDGPVLFFTDLDWQNGGMHGYIIDVEGIDEFSFNTTLSISEGPCCGGIPLMDTILINNMQMEFDSVSGFYEISLN
mgnify:CR=1 FL=1